MELTDILPLDEWVTLEKAIYQRSGLNASVFDIDGIRITDYKQWSNRLCPEIKDNDKGQTFICAAAHQNIAAIAMNTREPVVEECDAGLVKIVAPVFVGDTFLGGVGGCGLLLGQEGEVESFLIEKTTDIPEETIEELSDGIGRISMEDAEALGRFIAGEVAAIVAKYEASK